MLNLKVYEKLKRKQLQFFLLFQIEKESIVAQYEFNFGYTDAMSSADRMLFFKFMVKVQSAIWCFSVSEEG